MSGYQASCPACGASLTFGLGATLLKVCEHCGVAVARKGANLEDYGRVAELIPTPSVLALGLEGRPAEGKPFSLVGRLQLDHGSGTWDEWLMASSDESWAWLSESQGRFHLMRPERLPPVPRFEELTPGDTVDLGPPGVFVVSEVREGRFVSARGELPFDARPGSPLRYADLSGPAGRFATLDFGDGSQAEALYVGREVELASLGFRDLPDEAQRRQRASGGALSCPQCGGPLEIRAPDQTERIACPYCGSLLDARNDLAVLQALDSVPVAPLIPLGSEGRLRGVRWTLIGFMQRSVTVEGIRYPWQEYLLYEPKAGFRWLVEAKGHWSFVEPVPAGDVGYASVDSGAHFGGVRYKHFQSGQARVDHVLGEFYWAVAQGDVTGTMDFVAPPHMLSKEWTDAEVTWSRGSYLSGEEVYAGFGMKTAPPEPQGVAPHQPWPQRDEAPAVYTRAALFVAILFVLYIGFLIAGGRTLAQRDLDVPHGVASGAPEAARFVGPFEVSRTGNLQIKVEAPVSNSWLYLDGALIGDDTGEVSEFDVEVSYYFGRDSDGSWSEGGQTATAYIPAVAPGRYTLRLAPQWPTSGAVSQYHVRVRSRVPRFTHVLLGLVVLGAWPLSLAWRQFRFEMQRWAESDHPWVTQEE